MYFLTPMHDLILVPYIDYIRCLGVPKFFDLVHVTLFIHILYITGFRPYANAKVEKHLPLLELMTRLAYIEFIYSNEIHRITNNN